VKALSSSPSTTKKKIEVISCILSSHNGIKLKSTARETTKTIQTQRGKTIPFE
jgi:hypothetical protein